MAKKREKNGGGGGGGGVQVVSSAERMMYTSISPRRLSPSGRRPAPSAPIDIRGRSHRHQRTPTSTPPTSSCELSPLTPVAASAAAPFYAGCKWSETPSPSSLPKPPRHWMPAPSSGGGSSVPHSLFSEYHRDADDVVTGRLKMLLKVQV